MRSIEPCEQRSKLGCGGAKVTRGYKPEEYDSDETGVQITFDWAAPEPRTRDYPGTPGAIWITRVVTDVGKELNVDQMPDKLREHFEEIAGEHLNEEELRALADYEDHMDARREEEKIRSLDR